VAVNGWELVRRGNRRLGGRNGTLGTVSRNVTSSGQTTAILNSLINTTLDDTAFAADRLLFPESAAGSQQTSIIQWTDATGTARFTDLAAGPVAGDDFILVNREDYTLHEFEDALRKCLRAARRTYRYVIPTTPLLELYPLSEMDWLEGAGSIDAVFWSNSPLMLHNEDFSLWQNGGSAAPDGYTLSGVGATVSRQSNGLRSAYQARLTRVGADAELTQQIPGMLTQWLTRRSFPVFIQMRAAGWVTCSTASVARVGVRYTDSGGTTTTQWSDYHTGTGVPQFLSTSLTPTGTMNDFTFVFQVANSAASADIGAAVLMQNTLDAQQAYQVKDQGSQAYFETDYTHAVRNIGGVPTVDLRTFPGTYGQLIVYSRRPFPELSDLDDVFEEQYARALEAGLLTFLLDNVKPAQDRSRIDYILNGDPKSRQTGERQRWVAFLQQNVSLPVTPPMNYQVVGPA